MCGATGKRVCVSCGLECCERHGWAGLCALCWQFTLAVLSFAVVLGAMWYLTG
jgi:hypothetical protein